MEMPDIFLAAQQGPAVDCRFIWRRWVCGDSDTTPSINVTHVFLKFSNVVSSELITSSLKSVKNEDVSNKYKGLFCPYLVHNKLLKHLGA